MSDYKPTIGLEIHAELKTQTKMFCDSLNDSDEKHPNVNVCPVCLGHPGTLPTINKKAVEHVIRVGLALGGTIAKKTKFDRKNYFYPDLPKGYQISQYDEPIVSGGVLRGVRITRIHLEEDAGNLLHDQEGHSLVDFNRAGIPLMELVTEPDIKSAEEAILFARELQRIVRYLGASDANMEKGEFRVEVNISMSRDDGLLGTKVELKNLNSFKAIEKGVAYEIERQTALMRDGKKVIQETRGWDEALQATVSQRWKEEAHDYRYFPEPDLPPFITEAFNVDALREELPEFPAAKRERFAKEFGISAPQIDVLVDESSRAAFFENAASELAGFVSEPNYALLCNYFLSDFLGIMNERSITFEDIRVTPEQFAHLVSFISNKKITSRVAKDVLLKMVETGSDPEQIVKGEGLEMVEDEDMLRKTVQEIIGANPTAVADYKNGKTEVIQFLVGQAMRELRGKGDPKKLAEIFKKTL